MNFPGIVNIVTSTMKKHNSEILTGLGIAGMLATTILAVRATPKACLDIEDATEDKGERLTKIETVKVAGKYYIPAAITCVVSTACLIGASTMSARRSAALATAYTVTETALREYKEKTAELVGERKEKEIREAVIQDKLDKTPVPDTNGVVITGHGDTLCYDVFGGRYFKSSMEFLKQAVNDLNERLLQDGYVSLNDFFDFADLDQQKLGDDLGWDSRNGQVRISFSSHLAWGKVPCLVVDFSVDPKYDYYH